MFSQLTLDGLSQWYLVAYFSYKMIPTKTRYKTHDGKFLAIIEDFKTRRHYLEGCKHEVLVLTNHNNPHRFMDTKNLSCCQVRWTQELSRYYFRIDYYQGKANGVADALSCFPQRDNEEKANLRVKNTQILHCFQSSLINVSISELRDLNLLPQHQVFICRTQTFPQLHEFWNTFRTELANKGFY